eukprot:scaffold331669_cov28-Prasinocladus_malaysianus.AAC.2
MLMWWADAGQHKYMTQEGQVIDTTILDIDGDLDLIDVQVRAPSTGTLSTIFLRPVSDISSHILNQTQKQTTCSHWCQRFTFFSVRVSGLSSFCALRPTQDVRSWKADATDLFDSLRALSIMRMINFVDQSA